MRRAAGVILTLLGTNQWLTLGIVVGAQSPEVFSYSWATLCCPLTQPSQRSRQVFFR